MEDVREFRPYEHTFDGRDAGYVTAAFPKRRRGTVRTVNQAGAKSVATPEDAWFYRYDQKHVEVRDVARCRDKVFASLHVSRMQEEEGEELSIVRVLHTMVNDERVLLIAATDKQTAECRFVFFNPFTLAMTALPLGVTVMGTIISVSVSEPYAPSEIDVQNYMAQGQAPPRSYNLLVVGMADSTVHVNKLFQHADNIVVESTIIPLSKAYGVISALDSHSIVIDAVSSSSSASEEGTAPVIVVGFSNGRVEAFRLQKPKERREKEYQGVLLIDPADTRAPVTKLEIIPMNDVNEIVLLVAQGTVLSTTKSNERPSVSMYQIRFQMAAVPSLVKLLGRVAATVTSSELVEGGQTLATALLEENDRYHLIVAFSVRTQLRTRIELGAWYMRAGDGYLEEVRREDVSAFSSELLQDVVPRRHSLECYLLYPNKMAAYIGFLDSIEDEGDDDSQMEDIVEHPEFDDWYETDDFPHDTLALRQIKDRRKRMGNELFIDKLLIFTGLEVGELYPPNKIDDMRKLWWKILNCDLDSLKKYCIVYYLLKDWNGDKEGFAQRYLIPTGCMRLMDGYWAIDHWDFEAALRQLAYPTVEVDWPSKIVEVLYEHAGPRAAARFVNIAQPALWTPEEVELQMDVDVHCDVVGAFLFQRQHESYGEGHRRDRLLKKLFDHCFSVKENKSSNINRLLSLPLDPEEEAFMIRYCLQSPHPFCKDFLIMYYVHHGRYIEAVRLNHQLRAQEGPHSGSGGKAGINRNAIIENLKLLLPGVQKEMLDLESKRANTASGPPRFSRENSKDAAGDIQMEFSPVFHDDDSAAGTQESDEVLVGLLEPRSMTSSSWSLVDSEVRESGIVANRAPLSASKDIRHFAGEIDTNDVKLNPQKATLKALLAGQMLRTTPDGSSAPYASAKPLDSSTTNQPALSTPRQSFDTLAQEIVMPTSPFVGPPSTPRDDAIDRLRDQQHLPTLHSPLATLTQERPNNYKETLQANWGNILVGSSADQFGETSSIQPYGQTDVTPGQSMAPSSAGAVLTSMSPFSPKKSKQDQSTRQTRVRKSDLGIPGSLGAKFQLASPEVKGKERAVRRSDRHRARRAEEDMEITDAVDDIHERTRRGSNQSEQTGDTTFDDEAEATRTPVPISRRAPAPSTSATQMTTPRRSERRPRTARSTLNAEDVNLARNTRWRTPHAQLESSTSTHVDGAVSKAPKRKSSRTKSQEEVSLGGDNESMSSSETFVVGPPGRTPAARRKQLAPVRPVDSPTMGASPRPNPKVRTQPPTSTSQIGKKSRKSKTADV